MGNLAGRPMELPGRTALNTGATAPRLSYSPVQRRPLKYPPPSCPCSLLSLVWKDPVTLAMALLKLRGPALP